MICISRYRTIVHALSTPFGLSTHFFSCSTRIQLILDIYNNKPSRQISYPYPYKPYNQSTCPPLCLPQTELPPPHPHQAHLQAVHLALTQLQRPLTLVHTLVSSYMLSYEHTLRRRIPQIQSPIRRVERDGNGRLDNAERFPPPISAKRSLNSSSAHHPYTTRSSSFVHISILQRSLIPAFPPTQYVSIPSNHIMIESNPTEPEERKYVIHLSVACNYSLVCCCYYCYVHLY